MLQSQAYKRRQKRDNLRRSAPRLLALIAHGVDHSKELFEVGRAGGFPRHRNMHVGHAGFADQTAFFR